MKTQVLTGIGKMEMREIRRPVIERDEDVLLKVEMVGVCGSDVHYYETGKIGSQVAEYPFIVGHECTATVEEVGKGVTRVKIGEKVVVDPAIVCGECEQCRGGRENTCRKLKFLGCPGQAEGCLCEYIVMPERCCYGIDGKIGFEEGVLCEPFAIGVYAVELSQAVTGAKAAILGAGPIGLSCMVAARAQRTETVYVTDKIDERVAVAKSNGAVWAGNPEREDIVEAILEREPLGVNVVYECAGEQDAIDQAVELLAPGGKLMLIGIPRVERISFVIERIRRKEITIVNIRRQNDCTQKAIDLIASGKAKVDFMITHRFGFKQTAEAFELVAGYGEGVVKALIKI